MAQSRTIFVAGAGIGGLTTSLCLAAKGFRVICVDKAEQLEEVGAGLQITPNASRILISLGLESELAKRATLPDAVQVMNGRTGKRIVTLPLGEAATYRYNAPYWVLHRADLQGVLLGAAQAHPDIEVRLGTHCEDFVSHAHGVTAVLRKGTQRSHEPGLALIGADGVWSNVRHRLHGRVTPQFSNRTAWRTTIDASLLPRGLIGRSVLLWLGANAHLVVYPIKGGNKINIVAIVPDTWNRPGWSEPGDPQVILAQFGAPQWANIVRMLLGAADEWKRWALFAVPPLPFYAQGNVALLGDAAHAMLPFLAQGAGMAIEDAAMIAQCLADQPDDIAAALKSYDARRFDRVRSVQRASQQNGQIYHLDGLAAFARDTTMRALGGRRILSRYDWIYDWRLA